MQARLLSVTSGMPLGRRFSDNESRLQEKRCSTLPTRAAHRRFQQNRLEAAGELPARAPSLPTRHTRSAERLAASRGAQEQVHLPVRRPTSSSSRRVVEKAPKGTQQDDDLRGLRSRCEPTAMSGRIARNAPAPLRVLVFAVCVHFACTVAMLCRVAPPLVLQALNAMCFEPDHPPDG